MNKVTLIGRVGQDAELRSTQAGKPVANFSIATSKSWKDQSGKKQEKTEWHRIVAWDGLAKCCEHVKKGMLVSVIGELQTRDWVDKDNQKRYITEINAKEIEFLSSPKSSDGTKSTSSQQNQPINSGDDTIPF